MKSKSETLTLWEQRIREQKQSGIMIKDWCKQNGVSCQQHYYWRQRVQTIANTPFHQEVAFAELTLVLKKQVQLQTGDDSLPDLQIFYREVQVSVPCGFDPETLAGLMKVLQKI